MYQRVLVFHKKVHQKPLLHQKVQRPLASTAGQETEQLTKATMGQGTVKNTTDTTNRDINNTQEITRDQTTGMLDGSVTVDHRLLTDDGRKEIIQEQKNLPQNAEIHKNDRSWCHKPGG